MIFGTFKLHETASFVIPKISHAHTHTHTHNHLTPFFQDNLDRPVPEGQTIRDFAKARDDGVAVASGEPYANHLHLAPDK